MPSSAPPPGGRRAFFIAGRDAAAARSLAGRMGSSTADLLFPLLFPPTLISVTPDTGPIAGGAVVDLAGMNFRSGATATFDGIPATGVIFVSSTHITATTPAHAAGAVNVTITNPDLQSSTLVNGFSYLSLLIPEDAGTIFHLHVSDGVVLDTQGNVITETGSVPRVPSQPMGFPNGKSAEGIGEFLSTRFFSLPAGLLNFTTPLWVTVVGKMGAAGVANELVLSAHSGRVIVTNNAAGGDVAFSWAGTVSQAYSVYSGTNTGTIVAVPNLNANAIFIFSGGNNGNARFAKSNQGVTNTQNSIPSRAAFSGSPSIGFGPALADQFGTNAPLHGIIFEMRITTTAPTSAGLDALHSSIINDP
jgi:hypothetical protein